MAADERRDVELALGVDLAGEHGLHARARLRALAIRLDEWRTVDGCRTGARCEHRLGEICERLLDRADLVDLGLLPVDVDLGLLDDLRRSAPGRRRDRRNW